MTTNLLFLVTHLLCFETRMASIESLLTKADKSPVYRFVIWFYVLPLWCLCKSDCDTHRDDTGSTISQLNTIIVGFAEGHGDTCILICSDGEACYKGGLTLGMLFKGNYLWFIPMEVMWRHTLMVGIFFVLIGL